MSVNPQSTNPLDFLRDNSPRATPWLFTVASCVFETIHHANLLSANSLKAANIGRVSRSLSGLGGVWWIPWKTKTFGVPCDFLLFRTVFFHIREENYFPVDFPSHSTPFTRTFEDGIILSTISHKIPRVDCDLPIDSDPPITSFRHFLFTWCNITIFPVSKSNLYNCWSQ